MEQKINQYSLKERTVLRLGLRHHRNIEAGLMNLFREFGTPSGLANTLYTDSEVDERFLEIFVKYISKRLQFHIGDKIGNVKKPNNKRRTLNDENKAR
jgi:hypothetical protein